MFMVHSRWVRTALPAEGDLRGAFVPICSALPFRAAMHMAVWAWPVVAQLRQLFVFSARHRSIELQSLLAAREPQSVMSPFTVACRSVPFAFRCRTRTR